MDELPAEVALMWRLRDTPRRGPKPTLTLDEIVRAAIELADEENDLAAVSMARVAERLGNSTMALYRHVKSKDELLVLMSDAALEQPEPLPADVDWRTGLTFWADGVLAAIRKHRWYAKLPISGPPAGPNNLAWFDSALGALAGTGLPEEAKVGIVMGLITYVQGEIRMALDLSAGFADNPDAFRLYGATLTRVVDPRQLPALAKVLDAGVFDEVNNFEDDAEQDFDFGLQLYLDGVAAFIERLAQAK
ncbi:TetR/AcrR family transcriptional regulator [Kribbella sandramycini]|uniref:AcrR family transcriptional regulator n=1 Tax=Kribbella sandramycini TaxID=60450 RepID=A0A7Y4L330_9ACTN|nr:TetR/AcrR family transcriptional regulator [Kribbella sandramycini]MBB6571191.1 AcrR family transcriptional regulator [Kribbella sandramycini]NOL43402.1 TetR/AcrR family transcriptional regulator [Kribbella sandramycini]